MNHLVNVLQKYMIPLIVLAGFAACFLTLWIMNSQKLYTFSNISSSSHQLPELNSGSITAPIVYQLVYKSNSGSTWKFAPSMDILSDFNARRLNTLLIAGAMYKLNNVTIDNKNDMVITMTTSCNTQGSFVGSTCTQNTWPTNTTLFIIGYNFTGQQQQHEDEVSFIIPQAQEIKR